MLKQTKVNTKVGWTVCLALIIGGVPFYRPGQVAAEEAAPCTVSQPTTQTDTGDSTKTCPQETTQPAAEGSTLVGVPMIKDKTASYSDLPEKFTPDRSENAGDYSVAVPVSEPARAAPVAAPAVAENPPPPPARIHRVFRRALRPAPSVQAVAGAATAKPESTPATDNFLASNIPPLTYAASAGVNRLLAKWLTTVLLVAGMSAAIGVYLRPKAGRRGYSA